MSDRKRMLIKKVSIAPVPDHSRLTQTSPASLASLEREADRFATDALAASQTPAAQPLRSVADRHEPGGQELEAEQRSLLGQRLGHDFANVRVHTDNRAAAMAEGVHARAFTVGSDIFFGANEYRPQVPDGRALLAHELAHVTQQARPGTGTLFQRKLRFTGAATVTARALAILNGGLIGSTVSIDSSGNVTLASGGTQGPPTAEQQALRTRLETIINDSKTVSIAVGSGTTTLVGSYAGNAIDVADIEAFGNGPGATAAGALIHEVEEQYRKQAKSMTYGSETTGAHGEGIRAESEVTGATRGPQRVVSHTSNADGTINAVVEIPFTRPDGTVTTIRMTIDHNNVTSVTR